MVTLLRQVGLHWLPDPHPATLTPTPRQDWGEKKMEKHKMGQDGRLLTNYCHGQPRLDSGKIDLFLIKNRVG